MCQIHCLPGQSGHRHRIGRSNPRLRDNEVSQTEEVRKAGGNGDECSPEFRQLTAEDSGRVGKSIGDFLEKETLEHTRRISVSEHFGARVQR